MITFPRRVWLKTDGGWFSRPAEDYDHSMNALIAKLLEPGGKLTPDERESLDVYSESLRLEAEPLERDLRVKHGHTLPVRRNSSEQSPAPRSTRGNATISAAYGNGFRGWMRKVFSV